MKKILALALALCLVLGLAACTTNEPAGTTTTPAPAAKDYKLGMGVVVKTDSSKTGNAQVDATVATVEQLINELCPMFFRYMQFLMWLYFFYNLLRTYC